jgi:hypothetical protein
MRKRIAQPQNGRKIYQPRRPARGVITETSELPSEKAVISDPVIHDRPVTTLDAAEKLITAYPVKLLPSMAVLRVKHPQTQKLVEHSVVVNSLEELKKEFPVLANRSLDKAVFVVGV